MIYSSLTPAQRDQVAYLFADDVFGTDPHAYDYELSGESVVGRSSLTAKSSSLKVRKPHAVAVNVAVREVPAAFVTVEMRRDAQVSIQQIARSVVARLINQSSVEANNG